jgi:GNAT superfamily N-acetyltransferase/predicted RNA-binding protein with PIN domain
MNGAMHWVVDGMNVIGSRPDGWWRDRDAAVRRLVARLEQWAAHGEPVTLVLDGRPLPDLPEGRNGGIVVLYARRGGADAADERIVEVVRAEPRLYRVVTSDNALRATVRALGAETEGVAAFLERLDRLEGERSAVVRRLGASEVDDVLSVLAEAFADYPMMTFVLSGRDGVGMELLVRLFTMARVLRNEPLLGVRVGPELVGAALVSFPGGAQAPRELLALREEVWRTLGAEAEARYQAFGEATRIFSVDVPHVHLNMVGVRRAFRGRGLASLLVDEAQRVSRERPGSRGVTLSTEDPSNIPSYRRLGFELIGRLKVSPELESWGFYRPD